MPCLSEIMLPSPFKPLNSQELKLIASITPMIVGDRTYIVSEEEARTWAFTTWNLEAGQLSTEASLLVLFVHLFGSTHLSDLRMFFRRAFVPVAISFDWFSRCCTYLF